MSTTQRPSPPCHRGLGAEVRHIPDESVGTPQTPGFVVETVLGKCMGSRCPLWVVGGGGRHSSDTLTGLGVCADNLRAEPWVDRVIELENERTAARKARQERLDRQDRGEPDDEEEVLVARTVNCRVTHEPARAGESPTVRVVTCPDADGMVKSTFLYDGEPFNGERDAVIDLVEMVLSMVETPPDAKRQPGRCPDCRTPDLCARNGSCWPDGS